MEERIKAFIKLKANILINRYTSENVIFGRIKPYEEVPVEQYLFEIGFHNLEQFLDELIVDGENIICGLVRNRSFNARCFEVYRNSIYGVFIKMPKYKTYAEDSDLYHYKYGWYEYLRNLYPLFEEIIKTEVEPDLFTSVPELLDRTEIQNYYLAASKFVLAIKTNGLRQGRIVDRYVKKMNFISPLVQRLIKKQKGHFYLKNSDINSLDYKLALLSCFQFFNEDNAKLFELKILKWEENTKHRDTVIHKVSSPR